MRRGVALLAVCGGYQLLGRGYRGRDGSFMPGAGLFAHETVAGRRADDRRRPARLRARARAASARSRASRTTPGGRCSIRVPTPLGRVVHGFGNDGESGFEGCRLGRAIGTYLHGPLLPRNPWLADWLLAQALAHATGERAVRRSPPLADELERRGVPRRGRARARSAAVALAAVAQGAHISPR